MKTILLFDVFFLVLIYLTGRLVGALSNSEFTISECIGFGFVFFLALSEVLGWFCIAFQFQIRVFFIIVITIITLCIIFGFGVIRKDGLKSFHESQLTRWTGISMLVLIIIIVLSVIFYKADADDAFYVSNVNLFIVPTSSYSFESSMGNYSIKAPGMYSFEVWEALVAIFCKIFSISAAAMMHTAIIPVLLIISFCVYKMFGKKILISEDSASLFCILVTLFYLFSGYSVYTPGSFLFSRIWQGKSIYLHVIVPYILYLFVDCIKKEDLCSLDKRRLIIGLSAAIFAGIALNPTSLYIIGLLIVVVILAISWSKRNLEWIKVAIIPEGIICMLLIGLLIITKNETSANIGVSGNYKDLVFSVLQIFMNFWGSGWCYILLYLCATVVVYKAGNNIVSKVLFVYSPLLLLTFAWNPLSGALILKIIPATYWRVFWLIPVACTLSYASIVLFRKIESFKLSLIFLLIISCVICAPGKWMFSTENGFALANSIEKLPQEVDLFHENLNDNREHDVLACSDLSTTLCQKYSDIELVCSREMYLDRIKDKQEVEERTLLQEFSDGKLDRREFWRIDALLIKFNVGYVVLKKDNILGNQFLAAQKGVTLIQSSSEMLLYKLN